jgi:hypothetical protein
MGLHTSLGCVRIQNTFKGLRKDGKFSVGLSQEFFMKPDPYKIGMYIQFYRY